MHILIVTTETLPGYRVERIIGTVYGTAVRSRNVVGNLMGGVAAIFGGKQGGATNMVQQTRSDALEQLAQSARAAGANAVLAMRFDSGEFDSGQGQVMEQVTAYGTAAIVVAG
ncbi:YbjQ family protein [Acidithiobacillus sp. IBUN Pt1247-S3]|uniref:YbjQ family protein n=1 Tax=Acidithiobacillus sp. IBUN Pt1247-S3 TaxID=3166642 RepID=UPI0034E3EE9C